LLGLHQQQLGRLALELLLLRRVQLLKVGSLGAWVKDQHLYCSCWHYIWRHLQYTCPHWHYTSAWWHYSWCHWHYSSTCRQHLLLKVLVLLLLQGLNWLQHQLLLLHLRGLLLDVHLLQVITSWWAGNRLWLHHRYRSS
jgi:hypothetical protein